MRIRERPPLRLHASIVTPSGHVARWGPDEHAATNVPNDLTFSTTMPGGFEQASCSLPRKPDVAYPDLGPFSTLTIYGAGGQIAWQGRLESAPRTSGDHLAVTPGAVGWQAALDDNPTAREIYIDIDQTQWHGSSVQRQLALTAATIDVSDPSVETDTTTGAPSVKTAFACPWSRTHLCEAWYDAHGIPIAALIADWKKNTAVDATDTHWTWAIGLSDDDVASSYDITGNLRATGPGTAAKSPTTFTRKFAFLQLSYDIAVAGFDNIENAVFWVPMVQGRSLWEGVPLQGASSPYGVLATDVIRHAVAKYAPSLALSFAGEPTVKSSPTILSQLAFRDPTTASTIVKEATKFDLWDWAVWEGPTFWWYPRGSQRSWRARVGPSGLSETGLDASKLYNSVTVVFRDVDGSTISVGPTGSGATTIDDTLTDLDPENPATKAGLKRPGLLNLGIVSTPARAANAGQAFLAEQKLLNTSGQAVLTGHVEDDHGILWPAWMVRAGDQISFVDAHSTVNRRIVRSSYNDAQKTCSIDLDSPPDAMDALLQRLGASIQSLGL